MRTLNKIISTLLLLMFLSSCVNRSKEKNDLSELNLKGKVESVNEKTYFKFSFKEAEGGNKIIVEENNYKSDDIYSLKTWEFNGDGNIKEIYRKQVKEAHNLDKNMVNQSEKRKYDMMGRLKEETTTFGDGSVVTVTYDYPFMSKLCKSRKAVFGETTFKYDDKGNEIENSNPAFGTTKTQYTYNTKGWLASKTQSGSGGVIKTEYDLNADGEPMYETIFGEDGKVTEKKEFIEKVLRNWIKKDMGIIESYDEKGNVDLFEIYEDNFKNRISKDIYFYDYDSQGNWTKRIKCSHFGWKLAPDELTVRVIKY